MHKPVKAWWQRPQAFLYAWNLGGERARFLTVERRTLEASGFLDQRISADRSRLCDVGAAELLGEEIVGAIRDPGFIFHTAFCGSTLLARSLDLPGRSLVLREPSALLQLADLRRGLSTSGLTADTLLPTTLDLLARPFIAGERVILKPTNLANNLVSEIVKLRAGAKVLLLYDDLEPFLLSVLKRPRESKIGIRQFLIRFTADMPKGGEALVDTASLSLPEQAALAWTLQMRSLASSLATGMEQRVRILRASELFGAPETTLAAAARWLGVNLAETEAAAIVAGPRWNRHAKDPRLAYNPDRRNEEQRLARRLLARPVREGLAFARTRLRTDGVDFPPTLRLLP